MSEKKYFTGAVIGAIDIEIAYVAEFLNGREGWLRLSDNEYVNDSLGLKIVTWVLGPGKVNAAYGTADIINQYHPDAVINVGVAGGFVKGAKRGDVGIGIEYAQVDFIPFFEGNTPVINPSPDWLVNGAVKAASELGVVATTGPIVTGDFFLHDSKQKAEIEEKYHPVAFDMESGAIAQVTSAKNIDFISIRTYSDFADDNAPDMIFQDRPKEGQERKVTIEHSPVIIAIRTLENR